MNMHGKLQGHVEYLIEHIRNGEVIDHEIVRNLVPTEGLNHILSTEFKGGAAVTTWYLGLYEGNYTPISSIAAATLPAAATECTAYNEATRVAWAPGSVAGGALDNSASKAVFTFNATKTVYGGFLTSAAAKGATTGVLDSVVRFASPKALLSTDVLQVTAGFVLTST